MFKLATRLFRKRRLRGRFNGRTGRWSIRRSMPAPAEPEPAVSNDTTPAAAQCDLFPAVDMPVQETTLKSKYGSSRRRKKKKTKGLQYKIKFWKGIQGKERERKYTAQTRDSDQSNSFEWDDSSIYRVAALLVDRSFEEVFALEQKGSTRIAEIVAWVNRRFDDESPFNFEFCCSVAGYNVDELRSLFFDRLKRKHESTFPHYNVLRNGIIDAEHGDPDAIEWVLSDLDAPMTFRDCCFALGFDHLKARAAVLLPIVTHDDDALYEPGSSFQVSDLESAAPVQACA